MKQKVKKRIIKGGDGLERQAGVKGIEPLHIGIKTRCLTTWLYSKNAAK
jgi:hypothetical protein